MFFQLPLLQVTPRKANFVYNHTYCPMKITATISAICAAILLFATPSLARRGNPVAAGTNSAPKMQFYILDSDDNDPRSPVFSFVDTLYDAANWHRLTGFSNLDDGYAQITIGSAPTDS